MMLAEHRFLGPLFVLAIGLSAYISSGPTGNAQEPSQSAHRHRAAAGKAVPTMPGQEAFGTIQEIVGILEADPKTDWSKVNLAGLREHLIDMNELTLNARAVAAAMPGGLKVEVTGSGRTLGAIQRMVPAHAAMIDGHDGWHVAAKLLPNGALLTATASDPKEVAHIRGLGFIGLMVTGAHHQAHHLAIAEGRQPMHAYPGDGDRQTGPQ
jgi:hypothetical protein